MAYKSKYYAIEIFEEISQSAQYKDYAKANPTEAKFLADFAAAKADQLPFFTPVNATNTFMGTALLWAMMTAPFGRPAT